MEREREREREILFCFGYIICIIKVRFMCLWYLFTCYVKLASRVFLVIVICINHHFSSFKYFQNMENCAHFSYIHGVVLSLNSWWGLLWMWEEGYHFSVLRKYLKFFCPNVLKRQALLNPSALQSWTQVPT